MTVLETKQKIEKELEAVKESFGAASALVRCGVEIEVNHIEGAEEDITYVFGSLSIGPEGAEEDERLYLPLDAELDDNDIVDESKFEESLAQFKKKADDIKNRVLASDNYNEEVGTEICIGKIEDKIWELEGYRLQQWMFENTCCCEECECDECYEYDCDACDYDVNCNECEEYDCPLNTNN